MRNEERVEIAMQSGDWPQSMAKLAVDRLNHGDVSRTSYGIRVALRPDLKDNRSTSGATAYWPDNGCKCRSKKQHGVCSHELAAAAFEVTL